MRSVLSISLSEKDKKKVMARAKKAGKSVSSYILYTLNLEENLVSEDDLVRMSKKAKKDYKEGKTKELNSLADLLD